MDITLSKKFNYKNYNTVHVLNIYSKINNMLLNINKKRIKKLNKEK